MTNLAGEFKSVVKSVSKTEGLVTVLTGANPQASYLIQCDIACTAQTGVQVSIQIVKSGTPTVSAYLVKNAPVPQGSTLQVIDGQKLVLQAGDVLKVACETENGTVDVVVSYVDHVNLV